MPTVHAALRAAYPPRLAVGVALGRALGVWARNLIPFSLVALLLNAPLIAAAWLLFDRHLGGEFDPEVATVFAQVHRVLAFFFLQRLLTGTVMFAVVESLRGRPVRPGRSLSIAVVRLPRLVLVATIAGAATSLLLLLRLLGVPIDPATRALLLVAMLVLTVLFYVTEPVVMAERPRFFGLAALARSVRLTAKNRFRILYLVVLLGLIVWGARTAIRMALVFSGLPVSAPTLFYVGIALDSLVSPLLSAGQAVVYYELRRIKEGVDLEEIAGVFE